MVDEETFRVICDIAKNLDRIAYSLEGLNNCIIEHKDGRWALRIEIDGPIIAYSEA